MSRLTCILALVGSALLPLGCYARAGVATRVDYVETSYVPPHVETYPTYVYGGRSVYLVNGRWYERRGPRWVYYREEPAELHRQRVHVERAPRAPERHEAHRHRARPPRHDHD